MKATARSDRRRHPGRRARASGFTLIELLVAIALLAVIAVLSWRGLDSIARARETISSAMANQRVFAQTFDQMRIDAEHAVTDDEAGDAPVALTDGGLRIVRAFAAPPGAAPRLQVVRYEVHEGLVTRYASPPLGTRGELRAALAGGPGDGWSSVSLMGGVGAITARMFVPGTGWTDSMDTVRAAERDVQNAARAPVLGTGPLQRAVTGLQISIGAQQLHRPVTRVFLVGE